jgi:hypothetical protein
VTGIAPEFDVNTYNRLPQLETATAKLQRAQGPFDEFIREASKRVTRSKVTDGQLGAFLLHRHWKLAKGEMMVERPRVLESGKIALVTSSTDGARARRSGVQPSRWAAPSVGRPMVALEFSADPFVIEINQKVVSDPQLLRDLAQIVGAYKLQGTVGFMVIPRKSLRTERYPDFVETNVDGMSIVTGERLSAEAKQDIIMTGWPLASSRRGTVFACCYCSHPGGGQGCRHPKPDPPICRPHGCV